MKSKLKILGQKLRKVISLTLILSMLFLGQEALAEKGSNSVLMVGVYPVELDHSENQLLAGKEIIQSPMVDNWVDSFNRSDSETVILKQPSGFVGLYNKQGNLIRQVALTNDPNLSSYTDSVPAPVQTIPYERWDQVGYISGGRQDAYATQDSFAGNRYKKVAPGWGYNRLTRTGGSGRRLASGGSRNAILNFLSFAPLDIVSPFNYPGNFAQIGLGGAYSLGALPHIGGLALELQRAREGNRQYQALSKTVPYYVEQPVEYYNGPATKTPLGSTGPASYGVEPIGQAYRQNFPENAANIDAYRYGRGY